MDRGDQRVRRDDGGWDHRSCVDLSEEGALLREIFGHPVAARRRYAADRAGAFVGHVTSLDRKRALWVCTCGMSGGRHMGGFDRIQEDARRHKRESYAMHDDVIEQTEAL